jgi:hypothetical protein
VQPEISIALSEDFLQAVAERTAEIIAANQSRWL